MVRLALLLLLVAMVGWAFWRVIDGVVAGLRDNGLPPTRSGVVPRGVQMVRDPVCGTFVVPERALPLAVGGEQHFFCSARCRDAFKDRPA